MGLRPSDKNLIPKDGQGWRFLAIIDIVGRLVHRDGPSKRSTWLFRSRKEDGAGFLVFLHPDSRDKTLLIDLHRWTDYTFHLVNHHALRTKRDGRLGSFGPHLHRH